MIVDFPLPLGPDRTTRRQEVSTGEGSVRRWRGDQPEEGECGPRKAAERRMAWGCDAFQFAICISQLSFCIGCVSEDSQCKLTGGVGRRPRFPPVHCLHADRARSQRAVPLVTLGRVSQTR